MNGHVEKLTIDRFESLLDAYGGNLARWPARHALAAQGLLQGSREARLRLAEAQSLDRVLDKASSPDPQRLRLLADRIVAEVASEASRRDARGQPMPARQGGEGARIIRLPLPKTSSRRPIDDAGLAARSAPPTERRQWRAAAALAASLLIGMAIGLTDVAQTTTFGVASLTTASASDTDAVLSSLQIDSLNVLDEDQI